MPRIRTLKPELWQSPQVMRLHHSARLLFIGLITQADDQGRGSADPLKIRATIYPCDDVTHGDIECWLDLLAEVGLAEFYETANRGPVYVLTGWKRNQKIDKAKASTFPDPLPDESRPVATSSGAIANGRGDQGSRIGSDQIKDRKEGKGVEREERGTQEVLRGRKPEPEEGEGRRKVLELLKAQPDSTPTQLARVAQVPLETVQRVLEAQP